MKNTFVLSLSFVLAIRALDAAEVVVRPSARGDGLSSVCIVGDATEMNWVLTPDGTQYKPIGADDAFGVIRGLDAKVFKTDFRWKALPNGDVETVWAIENRSAAEATVPDFEIVMPFNDNYPDAATCVNRRCNAHVWPGDEAAYVCAIRMGGQGPHLGWMLTEGSLGGYAVSQRGNATGMSNCRGVIAMIAKGRKLAVGEKLTVKGRFFAHDGWDDFMRQLLVRGGDFATADRYVCRVGEEVCIRCGGAVTASVVVKRFATLGDQRVEVTLANGKRTHVEILVVPSAREMLEKRVDFILKHQQFDAEKMARDDADRLRDGAFLPYDNETDQIWCEWREAKPDPDRNEGRERLGMGILLAELVRDRGFRDPRIVPALEKYAKFVRRGLQEPNYKTWGDVTPRKWHRIYNYAWTARFYFDLYDVTGKAQYLEDAYQTSLATFRNGGYRFYLLDMPVEQSIRTLRRAGRAADAETLLREYRKVAANYLKSGLLVPKSEVNYEQSIIVPAANFLCEMYLVTGEAKYREGAERMLPAVEAFNGRQPSWHLNDVAIRHWDGYWFGKRRNYGDTFPHYWSAITADFFGHWAQATGDRTYAERASAICAANLGLFTPEGRGGCAWMYPDRLNGQPGKYLDPLANDQDYGLVFASRWLIDEPRYVTVPEAGCRAFETRVRQSDGELFYTYGVMPTNGVKCPIVVIRTPYDKPGARNLERLAREQADTVRRGYAKVYQQCRGSASSTGVRVPYVDERRDSLALLNFARQLPCYNGELFLEGGSYVSSVHWAYLDDCPPDVKGAVLNVQCANRYPVVMHNGFVKLGLHVGWFAGEYKKNIVGIMRNRDVTSWAIPFSDYSRRVFGDAEGPLAGMDDILAHPRHEDPFWQTVGGAGGEYRRAFTHSKIPILMRTGWFDIYVDALCDQWREATPDRKANCALVIDAFDHSGTRKGEATNATSVVHFPDGARYDACASVSALDWFDSVRGGAAPTNVNVGGVAWYNLWENKWHRGKEIPAGEKAVTLAVKGAAERSYRYDPRKPAKFPLGCGIGFGKLSRMPEPDFRPDVLSYLFDPIEATTDVAGRMQVAVKVKSDCEDTSFYVRVSVKKAGTDAWYGLRESIKAMTWDEGDYRPGDWRTIRFELADIAFRLEKGDQLRLDVSSSNAAMFAPHTNVKGLQAYVRDPKVATNAVSAEGPTLTLPCRSSSDKDEI